MELREKLENGALKLEERVRPEIALMKERVSDASVKAVAFIKAHPAQCLIGALAIGYLAGRLARGLGSRHATV
jgi:hypothetical protein